MTRTHTRGEMSGTSRNAGPRSPQQIAALHIQERLDRYLRPSQAAVFVGPTELSRGAPAAGRSVFDARR
jgi:hypothetical protein